MENGSRRAAARAGEKPTDNYGYGRCTFDAALADAGLQRGDSKG